MQIYVLLASVFLAASICFAQAGASASTSSSAIVLVAAEPAMFDTETTAQKHCPRDVVVWLNTNSGIYHEKGMRWYGRTKHGAYVCKKEADSASDRDTRNGQ